MAHTGAGEQRNRSPRNGGNVDVGSLTHVGMVRTANEDAFCAILSPDTPPGIDALLAVADGMGGHQAGEVASAMAIQGLVRELSDQGRANASATASKKWTAVLDEVVQRINAEVFQAAQQPDTQGMGTTLTIALLAGTSLSVAHVGDSRLYLLRDGRLQQISTDHSWVAEEVARGALTPEEALTHRRRNILTRAMGTASSLQVDTLEVQLQQGDTLLLCSDGLHSLVSDEEIAQVLAQQPPKAASQTLVDRANSLGGNDNVTVVAAKLQPDDGSTSTRGHSKVVFFPILAVAWILKRVWRILRFPFGRSRR